MRRALGAGALLGAALAALLLARTLTLRSRQIEIEPVAARGIDAEAAAGRLAEALRLRTISWELDRPPEAEAFRALHALIRRAFPRVHASLEREVVNEHSLLYRWPGSDSALEPVLAYAHLDVVPVDPPSEARWSHPPFAGVVADGFVWGRGAMDDKGAAFAALEALELLLAEGFAPRRTLYLALGHDEEISGEQGARAIAAALAQRGVRLAFSVDEGAGLSSGLIPGIAGRAATIAIAEKGYASLELRASGAGGHSSMPPPSTVIGTLARAIARLEANPMPASISGPVEAMLDYLTPELSFLPRLLVANRWLFGPVLVRGLASSPAANAMLRTTTAATIFQAGVKDNVLPAEARAVVNFRIRPGDSAESVLAHVRGTIDDPTIEVSVIEANEAPPVADTEGAGFALLHRSIREVFPDAIVLPMLTLGATDSRHLQGVARDCYRFVPMRVTPADLQRIHGTDERIAVEDYADMIRFYLRFLENAAG
jgi:carboxypeptidase PM20D1